MRAFLVVALLPILVAPAFADPDHAPSSGVRWYGLVDYIAVVTAVPGVGAGVEIASESDWISLDVSGGVLPICFYACTAYDWAGVSLAYHHRLTDHFFVGPRIAAVDRGVGVSEPTSDDLFGWTSLGLIEVGFRRRTETGWIASASLGAGISVQAGDHALGPAISVRVTFGK
ncbi:MAG TPA: hypothetical protein VGG74_16275 [Kofleriaceae bacterium]|jgi:hypothetical protein